MKRITRRKEDGSAYISLYCYPKNTNAILNVMVKRLAEYEELEERLIEKYGVDLKMIEDKWAEFADDIAELIRYRQTGLTPEDLKDSKE